MNKIIQVLTLLVMVLAGAAISLFIGWSSIKPIKRDILIKAHQYAYDPAKIEVNLGDTLVFKFISMDVVHGFYLEGLDLDIEIHPNQKVFKMRRPSEGHTWMDTTSIAVIANGYGKHKYRCSHTCGTMHPFMQGELIVNPNVQFYASVGGIIGFLIGMVFIFYRKIKAISPKK